MAKREKKAAALPRSHTHGAEVGAIAGEVVGGVVGSLAGPPGVIAGMVIGATAGALAGEALDRDATSESEHEHELDDAIGVTSGDLGRPSVKPPAMNPSASSDVPHAK